MTRARRLATIAGLTAGLVLTVTAGSAWGFWSAGTVTGPGASAAATVEQVAAPAAVAVGTVVTLSWDAGTLTSGQPVAGYVVERYDATTLARQTVATACDAIVTDTSCTESDVPAGPWVYSVTPMIGTQWIGPESPKSNVVTVDVTPPVNAVSVTGVTGGSFGIGTTVFYRGVDAGSFMLSNSVLDIGSGPASSTTAALTGDSTGWSHTPSTVSAPAGGPYVSGPFSWTVATVSAPAESVTGRDVAGNLATTILAFVNDMTAPSGGTITYADGYQAGATVDVSSTAGIDAGSGIATRQLQRSSASLTAGTCGTFGGFTDVGPDGPASPYTDGTVVDGSCDRYRLVVTDHVGNQSVATSPNVALVDSGGGGPALGSAGSFSVLGGTGITSTGITSVDGDLAVGPGSAVVGFPPGIVAGAIHTGDDAAVQALADLVAAYDDAAGRTASSSFAGDLNGQTFYAGVHHSAAAFALTGTLTLDGQGDPNAVFIFQVDAALNTAAASTVQLINGAQASHVFWQVNGAAGTGASSSFSGTILAAGAITLGAGSQLIGRALARGAVTLAGNTVGIL